MITINLLSIHIVFCMNLQWKIWWLLLSTLRFLLETVRQLHAQHTYPIGAMRRITSITDKLDFSWDPGITLIFSGVDLTLSVACVFPDLPSIAVDPSRRPPTSTAIVRTWCTIDVPRTPPWPDWDASCGGAHTRQGRVFPIQEEMTRTSQRLHDSTLEYDVCSSLALVLVFWYSLFIFLN